MFQGPSPEIFTAGEIARAAGVSIHEVDAALAAGDVRPLPGTRFFAVADAVRLGRRLRTVPPARRGAASELFAATGHSATERRRGLLASAAVHAALIALALWFSADAADTAPIEEPHPTSRLVFIMSPGPGGGGGGGGLRNPLPTPKLRRLGVPRPRPSVPEVKREEVAPVPRPPAPEPLPPPPVLAPVVATPADTEDRAGTVDTPKETVGSQGPGTDGGFGATQGTGNGEGFGSGIGDGSGGGAGGGPYRPGSGISPPRLVREVKAEYTEEARRSGTTGNVLLEIVVRRDGSVGDLSVLRGLGGGLDQRAAAAVRQWRFDPARLRGTPVDVIVEVSVEFTLR